MVVALLWATIPLRLVGQRPELGYRLVVSVSDSLGVARGTAEIRYRQTARESLRVVTLALTPANKKAAVRLLGVRVDGVPGPPPSPGSTGSDTVRLALARPLGRGDSAVIALSWQAVGLAPEAADSSRRVDLIAWYPRVIDETSGTSVPFPAFATFLVELDVARDQVLGGTGVTVCGDPGWAEAAAGPDPVVTMQRDWYRLPRDPEVAGADCGGAAPGRKRVVWYAENVPEVAYVMSPEFRYEEGDFLERPVRALYRRGGERVWGAGLATRRTETALAWTLELGDRYPWPQITIVEGPADGEAALPMVLRVSLPSQAIVLNQLGLMITEQMLGGGARAFTVGTAAYQAAWFFEVLGRRGDYRRIERVLLDWDLDRVGLRDEPLGGPSAASPCGTVFCRRTEFLSYQLRRWAGSDEAMRGLYRALYTRYVLKPTVPGAFQAVARELIRPAPDSLYRQVLRGVLLDYALGPVRCGRSDDGRWRTEIVVERRGEGIFPETVAVMADSDTVLVRATALAPRETLTVVTRSRPRRVRLDPAVESHDWNMLNNEHVFGFRPGWLLLAPDRPTDAYFDTYFARHTARDRLTLGWAPTVWYNDAGGWTFGGRLREDYLGRFELNEVWASLSTGAGVARGRVEPNARLRLRNPVWLRAPGWSEGLGLAWEEGRVAADLALTRRFRTGVMDSTLRTLRFGLRWMTVTQLAYLDPRFYDDAGVAEMALTARLRRGGAWRLTLEAAAGGGYAYPNRGAALSAGTYGRFILAGAMRGPVSRSLTLGLRLFAGATLTGDSVPRQRRFYLAGADPVERFTSPFLRSRGSLLSRPGFHYHDPGGAGVRGLDPRLSADRALGASLELERALYRHAPGTFLSRVAIAGFADLAVARGDLEPGRLRGVADAGVGLRLDQRLGRTAFQTRFDLPLWVSRPALAQDHSPTQTFGLRWSLSFAPSF